MFLLDIWFVATTIVELESDLSGTGLKWMDPSLKKNDHSRCWGYLSLLNYIVSIAKTASKKIGACIRSMKLLYSEVSLYSLPYRFAWNAVVMPALVLPSGT